MINKDTYKRLTSKSIKNLGGNAMPQIYYDCYNRLAELEDKIEDGTLIFLNEPFYSKDNECYGIYSRRGDIVHTCFMTEAQAEAKLKDLQEGKNDLP